jgi:hypothetical protein
MGRPHYRDADAAHGAVLKSGAIGKITIAPLSVVV